jgi:hypothetical protein
MKIVETVKKTYLAADVEETDATTKLKGAVVVDTEEADEVVARNYVRGTLLGKVVNVTLKNANVESVQDADEVGPLVELMMKYLPLAEKNAKANSVLAELDALMGGKNTSDDDES